MSIFNVQVSNSILLHDTTLDVQNIVTISFVTMRILTIIPRSLVLTFTYLLQRYLTRCFNSTSQQQCSFYHDAALLLADCDKSHLRAHRLQVILVFNNSTDSKLLLFVGFFVCVSVLFLRLLLVIRSQAWHCALSDTYTVLVC